jgi:hypothetical protein
MNEKQWVFWFQWFLIVERMLNQNLIPVKVKNYHELCQQKANDFH